jgi:hypothetical protein
MAKRTKNRRLAAWTDKQLKNAAESMMRDKNIKHPL